MRIVNLIENTCRQGNLQTEHGLSLYVETPNHKILFDTGASDAFWENAQQLNVDLSQVDSLVLSHGHYDHCGGVMAFAKRNPQAVIYLQRRALGDYWLCSATEQRYIGIDPAIKTLPNLRLLDGNWRIDEELFLFTGGGSGRFLPVTNGELWEKTGSGLIADEWTHEQYLAVRTPNHTLLLSGCAHRGLSNIVETYEALFGAPPNIAVSGFHTMNGQGYSREERERIDCLGVHLAEYPTIFYTGHCTGLQPYYWLKEKMGDKIHYFSTGEELVVGV